MFMRFAFIAPFVLALLTACFSEGSITTSEFWNRLERLCGNAYAGELVSTDDVDAEMADEPMVMYVRECSDTEIKIPFYVGDDRSRTWVLKRNGSILELRHDHRHEDGSEDALTQYGGFSTDNSSGSRQNFPADDATKALFDAEGIPVSKQNTWAIEVRPSHQLFAYEMARPERLFRVHFDTSKPVDLPPPAWGAE